MRRTAMVFGLACLVFVGFTWAAPNHDLKIDYMEARSSSVYAGPCHYEGEFATTGREATLVWHIREGSWNDTLLAGLTVVAVVVADENLAVDETTRRSALYLDAAATPAQLVALRELFTRHKGQLLGEQVDVRAVPIQYTQEGLSYEVRAGDFLALSALSYPCHHCTEKPYQVWYKPFEPLAQPVVGKIANYEFQDRVLSTTWQQTTPTNSVFIGQLDIQSVSGDMLPLRMAGAQ